MIENPAELNQKLTSIFILFFSFSSSIVTFPSFCSSPTFTLMIKDIPGILETGLFINMVEKAYFGKSDGSVTTRVCKK